MDFPVVPSFVQRCRGQLELIQQQLAERPQDTKMPVIPKARLIALSGIQLKLHNRDLWKQFHAETTEMIITKVGRRMFPHLQLNISGLQENVYYCVVVEMEPASQKRHKYCGSATFDENGNKSGNFGGWTQAGQAESQPNIERRIYVHPESPAHGAHWMKHVVNFNKLKVTNSATESHSNVLLTSMHKYVPRIWIFQSKEVDTFNNLYARPHVSFAFRETEFIAVTAYQNERITKLKIDNNPFAKGFREIGHARHKRKLPEGDANNSSQVNDEDSSSSYESSPPLRRTAAMLLRTGALPNGAVDESRLPSPIVAPVQDLTSRAEDNHRNARPPTPSPRNYRLHRPWLDPPQPPYTLYASSAPVLQPSTFSDLYNFQMSTGLSPYNIAPTQHQYHHRPYHHFPYSNIRDWQETCYRMPPWYCKLIN